MRSMGFYCVPELYRGIVCGGGGILVRNFRRWITDARKLDDDEALRPDDG